MNYLHIRTFNEAVKANGLPDPDQFSHPVVGLFSNVVDTQQIAITWGKDEDVNMVHRYEALLAKSEPARDLADPDERAAAAMCYTTGTTGNPKGVMYSHRSLVLHTLGLSLDHCMGIREHDVVLAEPGDGEDPQTAAMGAAARGCRVLSFGQSALAARAYVERLLSEHMTGAAQHDSRLWALLILELWFRMWLDQPTESALLRPALAA
jgi:acyl-CoA synthetase (AMP-forming)/AMP-acid ligase II